MADRKATAFTEAVILVTDFIPFIKVGDSGNFRDSLADILDLYNARVATLTNKTFDANGVGNSITNIENADLASGVFSNITGLGAQSQALDMNTQILQFVDANQTIQNNAGNLFYAIAVGQVHLWRINNVTEMQLSATALAMQGNAVLQVGFLTSFAADPSTAGAIRLGNAQSINFRNAGNTANFGITGNASDQIAIDADLNMGGNNLTNGGVIFLTEQAEADPDVAGKGQIWVDLATPNKLFFTDDAGTDFDLTAGGGQTFARIVKKADETVNNSTTLQNDDELLVAINASKTYGFLLVLLYDATGAANIKYGWSVPTGTTMEWESLDAGAQNTVNETQTKAEAGGGAGTQVMINFVGRIITSTTTGNVNLQWAQNALEVSDTKVLQGSYFVVWEETA